MDAGFMLDTQDGVTFWRLVIKVTIPNRVKRRSTAARTISSEIVIRQCPNGKYKCSIVLFHNSVKPENIADFNNISQKISSCITNYIVNITHGTFNVNVRVHILFQFARRICMTFFLYQFIIWCALISF